MIRCAVTGGAGQIAYSLLFRIASGEVFGKDQPVALHILEIPQALKALEGVQMELEDCAYPLLQEIVIGSDPKEVFKDIDYAFLVGAFPRGPGMERNDLLHKNAQIFVEQGKALNQVANPNVKVLVVGNPCNTNAWIAMESAPNIPRENFFAMTRLDQNRAEAQIANRLGCGVSDVENFVIWGNHSSTQVPDFINAKVKGQKLLNSIDDRSWLEGEFLKTVQKRGAAIIEARGKSSAASAANAAIDSMRSIVQPQKDEIFSLALVSDGNPYDVQEGLIFSFPCRATAPGKVEIVAGFEWDAFLKEKIQLTQKELLEEKENVMSMAKT